MKRLAWLLVLPYVVNVSSESVCDAYSEVGVTVGHFLRVDCPKTHEETNYGILLNSATDFMLLVCTKEYKDYCYDQAEALNEAHERRVGSVVGEEVDLYIIKDSSGVEHACPEDPACLTSISTFTRSYADPGIIASPYAGR